MTGRRAMWNDGAPLENWLASDDAPPIATRHICQGGGGQGTSSQTSKSSNEPPEFIQPYLKGAIGDLSTLYAQNPNAPGYYPGSTVAPQSDATKQAISMLTTRGASGSPVTTAAQGNVTDTLNGKYLDPTANPDYLKAIDASHQPYVDQFMNTVVPGITSAFEGSGRTGSGLHQAAVDAATTNLNRTISDADAKAGAEYFTNARGQQLTAAGMAPGLAAADYTDIGAVGQAGDIADTYAQSKTDADVARYNYDQNKQWDYIARYLGLLNGGYPGGTTTSNSTGTSTQPSGGFGSIFGSALGAAGLGLQAFSMFSDARLKEDIEPVGKLHDGQTVYSYRYKGDPVPRIGLMAQEVEERHPEAVHVDPASGFKKVNYEMATRDARGLF